MSPVERGRHLVPNEEAEPSALKKAGRDLGKTVVMILLLLAAGVALLLGVLVLYVLARNGATAILDWGREAT